MSTSYKAQSFGTGRCTNVHPLLHRPAQSRLVCAERRRDRSITLVPLKGSTCMQPTRLEIPSRTGALMTEIAAAESSSHDLQSIDFSQIAQHEWPGLRTWRAKGRDLRLRWGPPSEPSTPLHLPPSEAPTLTACLPAGQPPPASLVEAGLLVLNTACPSAKAALTHAAWGAYLAGELPLRPALKRQQQCGQPPTQPPSPPPQLTQAHYRAHHQGRQQQQLVQQQQQQQPGQVQQQRQPDEQQRHHHQHQLMDRQSAAAAHLDPVAQPQPQQSANTGWADQQGSWGRRSERVVSSEQPEGPGLPGQLVRGAFGGGGELVDGGLAGERLPPELRGLGGGDGAAAPLAELLPVQPARPERPRLVRPKEIPGHESSPLGLNGYMLHNLAHIELNAIDLAWDTVVRFSHLDLPDQFYEDFTRVADDESRHLGWCLQRLAELGHCYGDMDAHDLLWQGCQLSAGDLGARLAVVPMSQEARGLDAGSRLVQRLVGCGDTRSAAVVALIAEEERAHVAVGVTWFTRICAALGIPPGPLYRRWLLHLNPDLLKGPFNHSERRRVGLPRDWYDPTAWENDGEEAAPAAPPAAARAADSTVAVGVAGSGGAEGAAPPLPPQRKRPTRGAPHPRLSGPQPVLSSAQLEVLAERLAAFTGIEGAAAGGRENKRGAGR